MVFPFGVSLGDFITGIKLICDSIQTLNEATGASYDHKQLLATLKSLISTLVEIDSLVSILRL